MTAHQTHSHRAIATSMETRQVVLESGHDTTGLGRRRGGAWGGRSSGRISGKIWNL